MTEPRVFVIAALSLTGVASRASDHGERIGGHAKGRARPQYMAMKNKVRSVRRPTICARSSYEEQSAICSAPDNLR